MVRGVSGMGTDVGTIRRMLRVRLRQRVVGGSSSSEDEARSIFARVTGGRRPPRLVRRRRRSGSYGEVVKPLDTLEVLPQRTRPARRASQSAGSRSSTRDRRDWSTALPASSSTPPPKARWRSGRGGVLSVSYGDQPGPLESPTGAWPALGDIPLSFSVARTRAMRAFSLLIGSLLSSASLISKRVPSVTM